MAVLPAFFGLLMVAVVTGQVVHIEPIQAVRKVGEDLRVICKVPYLIDSCRVSVGGTSYRLKPGDGEGDVVYFGEGLEKGECGAHIKNIKEEWNGNITCVLPPQSGSIEVQASMKLTIAKAPKQPQLLTPPEASFKEGQLFMAQCVAEDGRPAAKISWLLDGIELLNGIHQHVITSSNGDLETISQNYSRTLSADDTGKTLTCRVEHEALARPYDMNRQFDVQYAPKRNESGPLTIFGLKLNEAGRLNVTVRSNPAPHVVWRTAELILNAPQMSEDGRITALEPLHLGGGYYNVTLILEKVTKEDVDRSYSLQVINNVGSEEISVRISTMDEPAGVELDTGAIVGIVIAVLVFLIALSLGVFAFVTDRWCFAGRSHRTDIPDGVDSEAPLPPHDDVKGSENPSHDHGDYIGRRRDNTKSSGESTPAGDVLLEIGNPNPNASKNSDTESAVGGKERSRLASLGARVRAALPRGRDKVQATEVAAPELDEKEPEDKVVYAQLALSEQTTADKPPPPSAEYAEIVYTDQGQKEAKE